MTNDDWRPKVTRIDDPIADDHWEYITPRGERRVSRLMVGRPVHYPQEGVWYAPILIDGYLPGIKPVFGQGPVDALMNAMTLVRRFFEENSEVLPGVRPRKARQTRVKKGHGKAPAGKAPRKAAPAKARRRRSQSGKGS